MIYRLVIAVVALLLSTHGYGQFESIEVYVGPSRTMSVGESNSSFDAYSYGPLYSLSFGIGTRYKLNAHSGLAARLLFEDRGSKGNYAVRYVDQGDPLLGQATYKMNVKYFTLPLLYSLRFGRKIGFVFDAGPNIAYQLRRNMDFYQGSYASSGNYHDNNRFQLGITAGFGMEIPVGKCLGITVGLLNNLGLYTIGRGSEPPYANVVNLLGGLRYNLRSKEQ